MNNLITSKEVIMQVCRAIVSEKGIKSLNMRLVANECHIALGTLYNYYADKNALVKATVESIWRDIFHSGERDANDLSFPDYVAELFERIRKGADKYPDFLADHSISFVGDKCGEAKDVMEQTFSHMRLGFLEVLRSDSTVSDKAFSSAFSNEAFIGFVLNNLVILPAQEQPDCKVLLEIIRRTIY